MYRITLAGVCVLVMLSQAGTFTQGAQPPTVATDITAAEVQAVINAPTGVFAAGLRMKGHPAAIAGATLCATRLSGKLNGVMKLHTPTGTRLTMPR